MGRIREQQIKRLLMNPEHSEYCNCECPQGNSFNKLQETLNRVRMVHVYDVVDDVAFCKACPNPEPDGYIWQQWPCETIRALEDSE